MIYFVCIWWYVFVCEKATSIPMCSLKKLFYKYNSAFHCVCASLNKLGVMMTDDMKCVLMTAARPSNINVINQCANSCKCDLNMFRADYHQSDRSWFFYY